MKFCEYWSTGLEGERGQKKKHDDLIHLLPFLTLGEGPTKYYIPSPIPYARPEPLSLGQLPVPQDIDSATFSLLDILVHFACCALKNAAPSTYFSVTLIIKFLTILHQLCLKFVFLMARTMEITVIRNVTLCSLVACSQCSGGTWCF
jgi:hypothetical protein